MCASDRVKGPGTLKESRTIPCFDDINVLRLLGFAAYMTIVPTVKL